MAIPEGAAVLIIGMSMKTVLVALLTYVCERCGTGAAHEVTRHVRRLTLFFLPLFPLSTRYRDTCTACGRVIDISPEQAEWAANQPSSPGSTGHPVQPAAPVPTPQDRPAGEWPPQDRRA